ncbi:MAG: polyprenyl synthetase family protein [Bacillota bacterium]
MQEEKERLSNTFTRKQFYSRLRAFLYAACGTLSPIWERISADRGKLWRPKLLLSLAESGKGYADRRALDLAVAVELLHLATLVHDDIVDDSLLRRGKASLPAEWGCGCAVLTGDLLFAKSYDLFIRTGDAEVWAAANRVIMQMSQAELEQEIYRWEPGITEHVYLERCRKKTGSLFALSARIGAFCAAFSRANAERAEKFGELFGTAYQIHDDLMDICGSPEILGKPRGNDYSRGISTLPVIYILRKLGMEGINKWWGRRLSPAEMDEFALFLKKHGALEYTCLKVISYLDRAGAVLPCLMEKSGSVLRDCLFQLSDGVKSCING